MVKNQKGLSFRLTIVFGIFLIVTLLLSGLTTYFSQMSIYRRQCQRNISSVASYLASLIEADGEDFLIYKKYYEEHYAHVNIPIDIDEYLSCEETYNKLFAQRYPGKAPGVDIQPDEMDEDVAHAWFIYTHIYWLLTFEQARADFNLPYTYFLIPNEETQSNVYMIDGIRTSRAQHLRYLAENRSPNNVDRPQGDEEEYMYLYDEYINPFEEHQLLWKTWETGEIQDGYKVWHNVWGDTYCCYVPVWIDHEKVGLVAAEIDIADVNAEILKNTANQMCIIALVLIVCLIAAVVFINKRYISKLAALEASVQKYTSTKDAGVVEAIEKNIRGQDEIASLSKEIISMIIELENYIRSLVQVNAALADEKSNTARMMDLAHMDALTGIRNRMAYEKELQKLEWDLADGEKEFGIAMVDLNFLKRINDTYGHEQGNIAIKKLCCITCHTFEHSPVFRVGGDEFIIILRNHDLENRDALLEEFRSKLEKLREDSSLEPWEQISAAIGVAVYDQSRDAGVDNVVKRADQAMYENKKEMKAVRD